jgi:hypothetical protein
MVTPRVSLAIGELVLHGVPPAARHQVADAVVAELERLLAERGLGALAEGPVRIDSIDAGRLVPAPPAGTALGHAVARQVHASLAGDAGAKR